jgi:hypothetical protein
MMGTKFRELGLPDLAVLNEDIKLIMKDVFGGKGLKELDLPEETKLELSVKVASFGTHCYFKGHSRGKEIKSSKLKKFNINYHVYFKPSKYGQYLLDDAEAKLFYDIVEVDGEEYVKMQTWKFIQLFGKYISMATDPVSVDNVVYFEDKYLEEVK